MNGIVGGNLQLLTAQIEKDSKKGTFRLLISDDYLKALTYQKKIRETRKFEVGGDLLYGLMIELLNHINEVFLRIRLNDVDLSDENKTLMFLRKFSRSSDLIHQKLKIQLSDPDKMKGLEIFEFPVMGLENQIGFVKDQNGHNLLVLKIPSNYVYNRLISFLEKMLFSDLDRIDKGTRQSFLNRFQELRQNVEEKKQQIDMKYALELALDRIKILERDYSQQQQKIQVLLTQNDLYKRSYLSIKNRSNPKTKLAPDEAALEELEEA